MFKSNGGMEPWRQWLLSTGWDGLQNIKINKFTKEPLSPEDKHYINDWIAKNGNLQTQIQALMTKNNNYYQKIFFQKYYLVISFLCMKAINFHYYFLKFILFFFV